MVADKMYAQLLFVVLLLTGSTAYGEELTDKVPKDQDMSCSDELPECPDYAAKGFCDSDNFKIMSKCKKSCDTCDNQNEVTEQTVIPNLDEEEATMTNMKDISFTTNETAGLDLGVPKFIPNLMNLTLPANMTAAADEATRILDRELSNKIKELINATKIKELINATLPANMTTELDEATSILVEKSSNKTTELINKLFHKNNTFINGTNGVSGVRLTMVIVMLIGTLHIYLVNKPHFP